MICTALVGVALRTDDGRTFYIHEGDTVNGLTYQPGGVGEPKTITGKLRLIDGILHTSRYHVKTSSLDPWMYKYILPTGVVIDTSKECDAKVETISIMDITNIESITPMAGTDGSLVAPPVDEPVVEENGSEDDVPSTEDTDKTE